MIGADSAFGAVHTIHLVSRDRHPPSAQYARGSGGIHFDMAIHDIDAVRWLMRGQRVVEVWGEAHTHSRAGDVHGRLSHRPGVWARRRGHMCDKFTISFRCNSDNQQFTSCPLRPRSTCRGVRRMRHGTTRQRVRESSACAHE
jgi:hypothetical protein